MLYLTSDKFPIFVPFGVIGFYRYLWFTIRLLGSWAYRPIPLPEKPTYRPEEDVTIIVPTIDAGTEFLIAARSWLAGPQPKQIIVVTSDAMYNTMKAFTSNISDKIIVLSVPITNKRQQMACGIRHCQTDIIVFADDDAIWPPTMLPHILACFEDQQVGGVGTKQRVIAMGKRMTVWETIAAIRLSMRNVEITSSTHIDGGVPCLSGRTAAYRTLILKDPDFITTFTEDKWLDKYPLNSGDDKFLTRWLCSHGWVPYVQVSDETELLTTMKPDWRFMKQVLRWTRNTWRSDLRSLFIERHVWTRHPYVAYTMVDKCLNPFTLLLGPILVLYLCIRSTETRDGVHLFHLPAWNIIVSWFVWLIITRTLKISPHLWNRPQDLWAVPAWILFGYVFAVVKIYALFTLHKTQWGTRTLKDETMG